LLNLEGGQNHFCSAMDIHHIKEGKSFDFSRKEVK